MPGTAASSQSRLGPERLAVDPERSPLATSTTADDTPAAPGEPTVTAHSRPQSSRPRIKVPILCQRRLKAKAAAIKALEIDDTLAEAHASLAYEGKGMFEEAVKEFRKRSSAPREIRTTSRRSAMSMRPPGGGQRRGRCSRS